MSEESKRFDCQPFEEKMFYSIYEIADIFHCSPSKIRADVNRGLLVPIKVKPMVFAREAIDEYTKNSTEYMRQRYQQKIRPVV